MRFGYYVSDLSTAGSSASQTARGFSPIGPLASNEADGVDYVGAVGQKISRIGVGASRSTAGVDGTVSVALYVSSGPTTAPLTYVGDWLIDVTSDAKDFHYVDVNIVPEVGTRYIVGVGASVGANASSSTFTSGSYANSATWVAAGWLPNWSDNQFAWDSCAVGFLETESTLPKLEGPLSVNGDNTALSVTGQRLSVSVSDSVSVQASLDSFATTPLEVNTITLPTSNRTATSCEVDFNSGYADAISTKLSQFLVRFSDVNWSLRWKYKDDQGADIYLPFTHNPVATHVTIPAAKSQYVAGASSILDNVQVGMSEFDQLYLPKTVENSEGGITTLTIDYNAAGHPVPNYYGGDAEAVAATVDCAIGMSDGKARSFGQNITPITPPAAPTADATDITVDTTAYTADQT